MDINNYIEQLQEAGKVALQGNEDIKELQEELSKLGYNTSIEISDKNYLVLED